MKRSVEFQTPEVIWDIRSRAPGLLAALGREEPWVKSALQGMRTSFPTAATCLTFKKSPYLRLRGHQRAFYRQGPGQGVLAIKGADIFARDLPDAFAAMGRRTSRFSAAPLEHFPIVERKVPMALLTGEALDEARKAAEFQTAYFKRYRGFARIPLPLLVVRWPRAAVDRLREGLSPRLSRPARGIVQRLLKDGLSAYVYYYPNPPVRALHLAEDVGPADGGDYRRRLERLRLHGSVFLDRFDPLDAVRGWTTLVARMLALGYAPVTLSQHAVGQCVRGQNAVIDGGFADVDSLQPIRGIKGRAEFQDTFLTTLTELAATVDTLMVGLPGEPRRAALSLLIGCCLENELARQLKKELPKGAKLAPRMKAALASLQTFDRMDRTLNSFQSVPVKNSGD
ncbi:MAG: hypothetical protein ACHQ2Z_10645 [Elusimicrobiota bacterium]